MEERDKPQDWIFEYLFAETANFLRTAPFWDSPSTDHIQKLINEAMELKESPKDIMEYADCLICIIAAAVKENISPKDLLVATSRKLAIVKKLKWEKQPDGTYQSIKH